jgi:paraquat-inducible protein A
VTAAIIVVFSIVLPAAKIAALFVCWIRLQQGASVSPGLLSLVDQLGRWAMLDVLVVALVIVLLKSGSFTDATIAPAIYPFLAAIFLTAYSSRAVIRRARA